MLLLDRAVCKFARAAAAIRLGIRVLWLPPRCRAPGQAAEEARPARRYPRTELHRSPVVPTFYGAPVWCRQLVDKVLICRSRRFWSAVERATSRTGLR